MQFDGTLEEGSLTENWQDDAYVAATHSLWGCSPKGSKTCVDVVSAITTINVTNLLYAIHETLLS